MKRWQVAITLGIVCMVLSMAIAVQLKTIDNARENANSKVSLTLTSNELRDQVLKNKEKYDNTVKELEETERKLEEIRQVSTQNDGNAVTKEEQIKKDNIILGYTDVTGPGIIISLKDNSNLKDQSKIENIEWLLIHASDVVAVINDLRNAGAEAISINGQRVVDRTSVYCAGNVLNVNNVKIGSPIEIKAIGEADLLYGSLNIPGGYLELMRDTGITVTVRKSQDIKIEKYEGIIKAKEMKNE